MNNYSKWEDFLNADLNEWHDTIMGEIFTHRQEKNRPELPLLSVTGEDGVVDRDTLERRDTSNADKSKYLRVVSGDIVYNTMRMWQGVSGSAPKDGLVSPAYTVLEPKRSIASAFAKYLVKEERLVQVFHKNSQGLVDDTLNLKFANFSPIKVKIPPLPEQKKIASVLTSVDEVIKKTQSQINKLQNLKKGMINELLTKGIGHTEFKNSELGRIPKSWEVRKIEEIFKETRLLTSDERSNPLYSLTIEGGIVPKSERYERSFLLSDKSKDNYKILVKGDFALNPMNLRFGAISAHKQNFQVCVSKYYGTIRLKNISFSVQFYQELFQSKKMLNVYEAIATGTLDEKKRVHLKQFMKLNVPFPPIDEQLNLEKRILSLNTLIIEKDQRLQKIKSLKKSIMQDLLTGKVRVSVN